MKNILIISDGIPGHVNQSKGIASLLTQTHPSNINLCEMSFRVYPLRAFFTIIGRFLLKAPNWLTAKLVLLFYFPINLGDCDLIIAAGGKTAPYSAALRLLYNKPVIQLGSPRGMNSNLFSALVTIERYFDDPSNVIASLTPNLYSPEVCSRAATKQGLREHLLFLIGGEGIGYSYENHEWDSLIASIHNLYSETQFPITIVTSRRSNPEVEEKFRSQLANIPLDYSAWFHQGDKDFNLDALLGSAKNIFVTEDSAMMISESISSGQPVTTLYPSSIKSPIRYQQHIQKYLDLEFITRQSIKNFSLNEAKSSTQNVQTHLSNLTKKLVERIQW